MVCDDWPGFWGDAEERGHHLRIELCASTVADDLEAGLERGGAAIGPVRSDGVERISDGEDPGTGKDFVAFEAAGVAAAVIALVMSQDEFGSVAEKGYVFDEIEADLRVALHAFSFVRGERPGLEENGVGDSELADIVQMGTSG